MCCAASRHYASPSNDRWTAQRRPSRSAISPAGRFGGERPNPSATSPPTTTYPATTQTSHTRTKQWSTMACHDPRDYVLGHDLRVRILTAGWSNPRQNSTTTRNSVASWPVMKPTSCSRSIGMIGVFPFRSLSSRRIPGRWTKSELCYPDRDATAYRALVVDEGG